ncbi:MAG: insulinase family protein [Actinomycetota bacterium]
MTKTVDFKVGDAVGGYKVTRQEPLEHLSGTYYELVHEATGARHIHVAVPDDNKSFGIVFPTVPKDSAGVAHILEHLCLTGSKRYPVSDPFFAMLPRSLNTFMNASTSDDATVYLYSTRNDKDYYNLASVYLDASFFPFLREESFKQEGHRLEFEDAEDSSSALQIKGVVFNEMKGYMATALFTMREALGAALFPDLTYAYNAGGDPEDIPNLTWEGLKAFHSTHYHPSNAFFVTYGNEPPNKILELVENNVLKEFSKIDVDVDIPDTKRFDKPVEFKLGYPLGKEDDPSKKSHVQIAWATTKSTNSFDTLSMTVLGQVLLGNPASPLRKALIDSGLGEAMDDFNGFHTDYREAVFAAGLKGAAEGDAVKIENLVLETLEALVKDGIDVAQVDAAIHQIEIETREISDRPYPYAIKVVYGIAPAVTHGGDPYSRLQFDADLKKLEAARTSGQFFEELIRTWLIDNPHRARIVVFPDTGLEEARREREAAKVAKIAESLSESDTQKILDDSAVLKRLQETNANLDSLPTLELSDIPMKFEDIPQQVEDISGAKVGFFPQPTNGLTYIDVRTDFSNLPERLKDRLGLFAYVVAKMGAAGDDYVAMAERIDAVTGGIAAGAGTRIKVTGSDDFLERLTLTGKALSRNNSEFVAILKDFLTAVEFDPKRLKELIAENKARYDTFVTFNGLQFAMLLATAQLKPSARIDERLSGLSYYSVLRELAEYSDEKIAEVIVDLNAIREHLFRSVGLEISVTADEKSLDELRVLVTSLVESLPSEAPSPQDKGTAFKPKGPEARTIAAPVNYNTRVFRTADYTDPDAPALMVVANFLGDKFLHRELREKAGAYGSGSFFAREGGLFTFYTSQDPNISKTYATFERSVSEVVEGRFTPDDLKEAILGACGQVDPLLSPDTKGRARFAADIAGYTLEVQAKFKQGLLEVTTDDMKRVAAKYLTVEGAALATLGNPEAIETANEEMGGVFEVSPV